jgi:tRNA threonylcarbamoyl adenosine modification protein (Sua5/YciO/YrdC/YwlC family)
MAGLASVSRLVDCTTAESRTEGLDAALDAVQRGELVVLPTDTVYGVGADAFTPTAVTALLEAKGRGRHLPPPVLVGTVRAANALIDDLGPYGQDLIDEFWPGALTIICRASPSLAWDLGDTKGTVAVRMPFHQLALELLKRTGPMAVSSANRTGIPPARTAAEARDQLGDTVSVYLEAGPSGDDEPSSIVDLTGPVPRLLRAGTIPAERLRDVLGVLITEDDEDDAADEDGAAGAADEAGAETARAADAAEPERTDDTAAARAERAADDADSARRTGD